MTKEQCQAKDWKAYGQVDGSKGRSLSFVDEHDSACSSTGIRVDRAEYETGWREGLKEFCTPGSAYQVGLSGAQYAGVCKDFGQETFLKNYKFGRENYLKKIRLAEIQKELSQLNEQAAKENTSTVGSILDGLGLSETSRKRSALQEEDHHLSNEIEENENRAPSGGSSISSLSHSDISNGLGAYLGSFVGFGVGHSIQGRYIETGWIFTATEVGAVAAIVVGTQDSNALAFSGLCALIGLKIWEATDLFTYAARAHEGYPHLSNAALLTTPSGGQIALTWGF